MKKLLLFIFLMGCFVNHHLLSDSHFSNISEKTLQQNRLIEDFSSKLLMVQDEFSKVIYPVSDSQELKLPKNLRASLDINHLESSGLNIQGLDCLRISGSGQFSETTYVEMIKSLSLSTKNLIILDLREESHGFVNGMPISWTDGENYANIHKTKDEIELDELQRLKYAIQTKHIIIDPLKIPNKLVVSSIKTEQELVEGSGATYIRLTVTDHQKPRDEAVDQFLDLIQKISSDDWIHIHCKGGRGRTTTFLTLFDIVKNISSVSLEDILARQYLIGGIDLTQIDKKDDERSQLAKDRLELIQKFYQYCQEVPDFHMRWSKWIETQRLS